MDVLSVIYAFVAHPKFVSMQFIKAGVRGHTDTASMHLALLPLFWAAGCASETPLQPSDRDSCDVTTALWILDDHQVSWPGTEMAENVLLSL